MDTNDGTNPGADDVDVDVEEGAGVDANGHDEPQFDEDGNPIEDNADAAEELEEVEFEGKKITLPKSVAPALMRQADYTRKTQEIAEMRRNLEAQATKQTEADEAILSSRAKVHAITTQLAEFETVDWRAWGATNPAAANEAWREYQLLKDAKAEAEGDLQKTVKDRELEAQRIRATQLEEARAILAKDIPGWGPELVTQLTEYGASIGYTRQELAEVTDPRAIKLLHLAMIGAKASKSQTAAQRLQQQQKAKPAPVVGGRAAPATGLSDNLSTAEWMKRRDAELAKKGRR